MSIKNMTVVASKRTPKQMSLEDRVEDLEEEVAKLRDELDEAKDNLKLIIRLYLKDNKKS